jgi:hypothetical protein
MDETTGPVEDQSTGLPLPGLKPQPGGGYKLCPRCVLLWIGLALVGYAAFMAYRRRRK